jgi:Flp pilus assembly protein CpaB
MSRTPLLVSLIAAIAGAALLRLYMHRFELERSGGPTTDVLVFAGDLELGATLDRSLLGTRPIPQAYLESRHVLASELDDVVGARLVTAGHAHEALAWTDLSSMHRGRRHLATLVPQGMRAMRIDPRGGFDALLRPGDRVDVLTASDTLEGTRALLERLLVLAVGHDMGSGNEGERRRQRGVTLAVTTDQARRLAHAERQSALRLVLRNPDDMHIEHIADGAGHREVLTTQAPQEPRHAR